MNKTAFCFQLCVKAELAGESTKNWPDFQCMYIYISSQHLLLKIVWAYSYRDNSLKYLIEITHLSIIKEFAFRRLYMINAI